MVPTNASQPADKTAATALQIKMLTGMVKSLMKAMEEEKKTQASQAKANENLIETLT